MIPLRAYNSVKRTVLRVKGLVRKYSMLTTDHDGEKLGDMVKSIMPCLNFDLHKGQCGRLGIIGGCKEYTGAPYFAAISALKVGADLAHVFCAERAAPVIKSYSPELIVHPILDADNAVEESCDWLPRLHTLIIGPGLGRDPKLLNNVKGILLKAKEMSIPMVIDADGVFLLSQEPSLIKDYTRAILTPNVVEFDRLFQAVLKDKPTDNAHENVSSLSTALGHVTIVRKGPEDIISNGHKMIVCACPGSPRRCGGQGDILAGVMGAFSHFTHHLNQSNQDPVLSEYGPTMCAAYAGSFFTRTCARHAYGALGRSTLTTDMIEKIHVTLQQEFESNL